MEKIIFTIGLTFFLTTNVFCQIETEINNNLDEAVLETNVNTEEETDIDNNTIKINNKEIKIQQLNINEATKEDLQTFGEFTSVQIESFLNYRKSFGKFISKYE